MQLQLVLAAVVLTVTPLVTHAQVDLSSDRAQFSYAIGHQIGTGLIRDQLDIDVEVLNEAIRDAAVRMRERLGDRDAHAPPPSPSTFGTETNGGSRSGAMSMSV